MGMDPTAGWSSLEELTSEEAGKTVESKGDEASEEEGKTSDEEADLLGREISNLSPLYSYSYMSEEEALSKVKLLKMKIKQLNRMKKESGDNRFDKEIKDMTTLKEKIIRNVKVLI